MFAFDPFLYKADRHHLVTFKLISMVVDFERAQINASKLDLNVWTRI